MPQVLHPLVTRSTETLTQKYVMFDFALPWDPTYLKTTSILCNTFSLPSILLKIFDMTIFLSDINCLCNYLDDCCEPRTLLNLRLILKKTYYVEIKIKTLSLHWFNTQTFLSIQSAGFSVNSINRVLTKWSINKLGTSLDVFNSILWLAFALTPIGAWSFKYTGVLWRAFVEFK